MTDKQSKLKKLAAQMRVNRTLDIKFFGSSKEDLRRLAEQAMEQVARDGKEIQKILPGISNSKGRKPKK